MLLPEMNDFEKGIWLDEKNEQLFRVNSKNGFDSFGLSLISASEVIDLL